MSGWVRLNVGMPRHPRIQPLSSDAFRMYVTGLCYSGEYVTDGVIPTSQAPRGRLARELERHGLWIPTDDGWVIHDWDQYQRSRADMIALIDGRRKRGRQQPRDEQGRFQQDDGDEP